MVKVQAIVEAMQNNELSISHHTFKGSRLNVVSLPDGTVVCANVVSGKMEVWSSEAETNNPKVFRKLHTALWNMLYTA